MTNSFCVMWYTSKLKLLFGVPFLILLAYHVLQQGDPTFSRVKNLKGKTSKEIILALVVCGDLEYLNVTLKTAIIFSQDVRLHMILFSDQETMPKLEIFMAELYQRTEKLGLSFTYQLKLTSIPHDFTKKRNPKQIRCTNQRLFFPSLLPEVDALLYLDMDTVILGNMSTIWAEFSHMNESQMVALGPDSVNTYGRIFPMPFVGKEGVNNGIILMNLTRMRQFDFETKAVKIFKKYENVTKFYDQDVMNALFASHPAGIRVLSCTFNFFAYSCTHSFCNDSLTNGIFIMHGNGGWLRRKIPTSVFPWVYKAMQNLTLNELQESPITFLNELAPTYIQQKVRCFSLNPAILFKNAYQYFYTLAVLANPGV